MVVPMGDVIPNSSGTKEMMSLGPQVADMEYQETDGWQCPLAKIEDCLTTTDLRFIMMVSTTSTCF
jgi:hypothetical protein